LKSMDMKSSKKAVGKGAGRKFRKIKTEEVLLVLIFAFVSVAAVFGGRYAAERLALTASETAFYSKDAQAFYALIQSADGNDTHVDFQTLIDFANQKGNVTVFAGAVSASFSTGVYSSDPDYQNAVKTGRGFTHDDFACGNNVALFINRGKSLMKNYAVIEEGGKEYVDSLNPVFDLAPENALLVGELDRDNFGGSAELVVYNLNSASAVNVITPVFVLDGGPAKRTQELFAELRELLETQGFTVTPFELPPAGLDITRFFKMDILNILVIAFAVLSAVVATAPITMLWAKKRFSDIAVRRLLGFGGDRIFWQLILRFLMMFNLGFLGAYGVMYIFKLTAGFELPGLFSGAVLIAYAAALAFNLLTALVPVIKCMRIEPGDALRRA